MTKLSVKKCYVAIKLASVQRLRVYVAEARLRHISDIAGQEFIYAQKEAEARKFLSSSQFTFNIDDAPYLHAEATRTGKARLEIANEWIRKADKLKFTLALVETIRFDAHEAIMGASTEEDIKLALDRARDCLLEV